MHQIDGNRETCPDGPERPSSRWHGSARLLSPSSTAASPSADTLAGTATLSGPKTVWRGDPRDTPQGSRLRSALRSEDHGGRHRDVFKGVATRDVEDLLTVMGIADMSPLKSATRPRGSTRSWRGDAPEILRRRDISTPGTREGAHQWDRPRRRHPHVDRRRARRRRPVLGVSIVLSEARVHWREFLA